MDHSTQAAEPRTISRRKAFGITGGVVGASALGGAVGVCSARSDLSDFQ